MSVHVFLGPTLGRDEALAIVPDAVVHPPVRHGDLLGLAVGAGDVVLVVDGFFHQSAPVRHKEILALLARGVRVVGASSMGALRAAELHPYGMIGIGRVFEMFAGGEVVSDDEVAVAHASDEDFRSVGDPLVNIRFGLAQASGKGVVTGEEAAVVLRRAQSLPYTARSWRLALRLVGKSDPALAARLAPWIEVHRAELAIKRLDAIEALTAIAEGRLPEAPALADEGSWRTAHLQAWMLRFGRGTDADAGGRASRAAQIHYTQLFDQDFPARWYRLAVASMATGAPGEDLPAWEERLLRRATQQGITLSTLRDSQVARWLSDTERGSLGERDRLLRVLVRTSTLSPGVPVGTDIERWCRSLLAADGSAARGVAASVASNAQMSRDNPARSPRSIRTSVLARDLALEWGLQEAAGAELDIAARDRGFASFTGAVEVFRYYWAGRRQPAALPGPVVPAAPHPHTPERMATS
ncbi:TfuA-like protein [Kitasatospora cineracea]